MFNIKPPTLLSDDDDHSRDGSFFACFSISAPPPIFRYSVVDQQSNILQARIYSIHLQETFPRIENRQ